MRPRSSGPRGAGFADATARRATIATLIGRVVAGMVQLTSDPVVGFLDALLDRATAEDLRWIADILRHVRHDFIFTHARFVLRYLDRCRSVEPTLVGDAIERLSAAAMTGEWSGCIDGESPRSD